jgi:hypothetical protein
VKQPNHKWNRQGVAFCLSKIFTPAVWHNLGKLAPEFEKDRERWFLRPLSLTALFNSLIEGRTLGTRFQDGRKMVGRLFEKEVRPGKHLSGFQAALRALPEKVIAGMRCACQEAVLAAGHDPARVGRHLCFGVDGTNQEAPHTAANEEYYGISTKGPLPQRLISTCFCLSQRVLWDWCAGPGNSSEPELILELIRRGPAGALYVKDAGTVGYEWFHEVLESGHHLLLRVGGNFSLWADEVGAVKEEGGRVWVWPQRRRKDSPPIALRLIVYPRTYYKKKHGKIVPRTETVYLLTDLPAEQLTVAEAQHLFGLRWPGNEIGHRGWKRILGKHKLASERPWNADKESEFSLLGCMFLQVLALIAQDPHAKEIPSLAQALDVWKDAVKAVLEGKAAAWLRARLKGCVLDKYVRHSAKVKRDSPPRKNHRPLKPPIFLQLDELAKAKVALMLNDLRMLQA